MLNDAEELDAHLKKLNARAAEAKIHLQEFSEQLPGNWEHVVTVAQRCYDAYAALMEARKVAG
ncbi:CCE_0567 family metalloprotein [Paraburkholderia nodosa]|uniref:CCE_0567 family metalloprotein n=1 Tax=Paraburkholderia nodosa TaxID=392320 RepID=UPI000484A37A|nr:CCE_0567 family metalloprotein [Paraburkholderia nodosa]